MNDQPDIVALVPRVHDPRDVLRDVLGSCRQGEPATEPPKNSRWGQCWQIFKNVCWAIGQLLWLGIIFLGIAGSFMMDDPLRAFLILVVFSIERVILGVQLERKKNNPDGD